MSNFEGTTNLFTSKVNKANPKEGLGDMIDSLDSDYEPFIDQILKNIFNKDKSIDDMINDVINGNFGELTFEEDGKVYDADVSAFFLQNNTYCSGFKHKVFDLGDDLLIVIAYGS